MSTTGPKKGDSVRRVGIIFSGGPAPAANSVIAAAATAFLADGREVIGFFHGYSKLQDYEKSKPLVEGKDYFKFTDKEAYGVRNQRGIIIGTARANPGKPVQKPADMKDPAKTAKLRQVYDCLVSMGVDALISIGGDDTLKTANYMYLFQQGLAADAKRVRVVHLPKTIDNDYRGIDFTFGFFTAVDFMAKELLNLHADSKATRAYFIAETMGRKAGWLSYGVGIAGESDLIVALEDIEGDLAVEETTTDKAGKTRKVKKLNLDALVGKIVDLIVAREKADKYYGTVVLAEGLAELLPESFLATLPRDEHGHISIGRLNIGSLVAEKASAEYEKRTGKTKRINGIQLGYEARCAPPHAFDVMLGSALGVGSYRALVEEGLDGHMVSTSGQLDMLYVPFKELINPETLVTEVRYILPGSDFHRLARYLEAPIK
jgi:6-phosphofructokinase 1